jgi:hypothetical protein
MRRDDGLQGLGFSVQMHDLQFTHCKTYLQLNTRLKHPATHCSNTIFFWVQIQKINTYSEFEFKNQIKVTYILLKFITSNLLT